MKKNNTNSLILILILISGFGVGILSCIIAYQFGEQALSVVKSPEENPAQKIAKQNKTKKTEKDGFKIINEKDILVQVYDSVYAQQQARKNNQSN